MSSKTQPCQDADSVYGKAGAKAEYDVFCKTHWAQAWALSCILMFLCTLLVFYGVIHRDSYSAAVQ